MDKINPQNYKQSIVRGLVYLLIALPFMSVVCVLMTILNVPYTLTMFATVVVGGIVVFLSMVIYGKIRQKREREKQDKFDPFKD